MELGRNAAGLVCRLAPCILSYHRQQFASCNADETGSSVNL